MMERLKNFWSDNFSLIIPFVLVAGYATVLVLLHYGIINIVLIQDSERFESMLEAFVTFLSIILSVFGFLIPSFIGEKGKSEAMNYFLKYADMQIFAHKLKNVVAVGLIAIFLTCVLFLKDIFSVNVCNIIVLIWLWLIFFFMCSSYRFISIMINLLLAEKKTFLQQAANRVTQEERKVIDQNIKRI